VDDGELFRNPSGTARHLSVAGGPKIGNAAARRLREAAISPPQESSVGSGESVRLSVPRLLDWIPEILFVLLTTVAGLVAGGRWIDPYGDPGFSWSLAHRISQGEVLYRDVYIAYGPLSPYLLGGVVRVVGSSTSALLLWNWIPAIVAGILLLRCAKPWLTTLERVACAALVIGMSVLAPGPGRLVFPYYAGVVHALALSLGAILLVRNGRPGTSTRALIGGLLAGLAFCAKQEVGVAALAALLAARLPRPREIWPQGWRTVAGFGLGVLPGVILAVSSASLRSLREDNHLWPADVTPPPELNRIYRMIAGMQPVDWVANLREVTWSFLLALLLLALVALLVARERRIEHWRRMLIIAAALAAWWLVEGFSHPIRSPVALSAGVAGIVAMFAIFRSDLPERSRLIAVGTFAFFVGARAILSPRISGSFDGPAHLATSLTGVVFCCVVAPALFLHAGRARSAMRRIAAALLLIVAGWYAVGGARSLSEPSKRRVETRKGDVFLVPDEATFFEKLRGEVRPGETALVIPEISATDVLFGLRSASPLLHIMPGWLDARVEGEMISRLEKAPPEVVVIFDRPMSEFGFPRFGHGYGTRLEGWILRNYRLMLSDRGGSIFRRPSGGGEAVRTLQSGSGRR
jgi:hypothetical protein